MSESWRLLAVVLMIFPIANASAAVAAKRSCGETATLAGRCAVIHGRLTVHANMRPYLWPVGTQRLIGVASPDGEIIMPPEVASIFNSHADAQVFGDFEVCRFTPPEVNIMQLACIAEAKNVRIRQEKH